MKHKRAMVIACMALCVGTVLSVTAFAEGKKPSENKPTAPSAVILDEGLKEGLKSGLKNGLKLGAKNGLKNGPKNGEKR